MQSAAKLPLNAVHAVRMSGTVAGKNYGNYNKPWKPFDK